MGDFEQGTVAESTEYNPKSRLKTAILLIFGLFAPIMIMVNTWGMFPEINMMSLFWMYNQSPYMPSFYGFSLTNPYALTSMFPFLLLRMVPVSQIYRYYNGKTTRKRAMIASCIGDGVFLVITMPSIIISIMFLNFYYIMLPIPLQMIVGLVILWRFPLPVPTAPFVGEEKSKLWWEKSSDTQQQKQEKPSKDDDDVLW